MRKDFFFPLKISKLPPSLLFLFFLLSNEAVRHAFNWRAAHFASSFFSSFVVLYLFGSSGEVPPVPNELMLLIAHFSSSRFSLLPQASFQ